MANGALSDLKVLDVSEYIAGPYCARLLADFGADVIKVERPATGDGARREGPFPGDVTDPEKSGLFIYLNQNKRGITLDLNAPAGAEIFRRLVARSDIIVDGSPPGYLGKLGLDFESLSNENPGIILTSVTPFGQTGPYAHYKATHLVLAALGGWAHTLRAPDRPPFQPGVPVIYYAGGVYGAVGSLAAVASRRHSGRGTHVDVSCLEATLNLMVFPTVLCQILGREPTFPNLSFPGPTECKDGYAAINVLSGDHWQTLCKWIGMEDVLEDPELSNAALRGDHAEELRPRILAWAKDKSRDEIFQEGQQWRLPTGLYNTVEDLLSLSHFRERAYFAEVAHPRAGRVRVPGAPFKASRSAWQHRSPAPQLGQDNEEIYCRTLGYSKADLVTFRREKVI